MSNRKEELKDMDKSQLKQKMEEMRQELFGLRLNASTTHIKDYSQFKKLRKDIARALTFYNQKVTNNS